MKLARPNEVDDRKQWLFCQPVALTLVLILSK